MDTTIEILRQEIESLKREFYRNNFSTHQDINKTVYFNSRMKVPHFDTPPTTCETGEIMESGGKLYIASAVNTWAIIGTQS